jgi:hypothetical protein
VGNAGAFSTSPMPLHNHQASVAAGSMAKSPRPSAVPHSSILRLLIDSDRSHFWARALRNLGYEVAITPINPVPAAHAASVEEHFRRGVTTETNALAALILCTAQCVYWGTEVSRRENKGNYP